MSTIITQTGTLITSILTWLTSFTTWILADDLAVKIQGVKEVNHVRIEVINVPVCVIIVLI